VTTDKFIHKLEESVSVASHTLELKKEAKFAQLIDVLTVWLNLMVDAQNAQQVQDLMIGEENVFANDFKPETKMNILLILDHFFIYDYVK